MQESDDGAHHVGFRDAIENEVLVDAETSSRRVTTLRLGSRPVGSGVVHLVRAEVREGGEVGLVLEEESEVAECLAGGVTRREVVAKDAVEYKGVAFRVFRV